MYDMPLLREEICRRREAGRCCPETGRTAVLASTPCHLKPLQLVGELSKLCNLAAFRDYHCHA